MLVDKNLNVRVEILEERNSIEKKIPFRTAATTS